MRSLVVGSLVTLAIMKTVIIVLVIVCGFVLPASAKTKSVRIYFVPWEIETFGGMTQNQVRGSASLTIDISDSWYADAFVKWLDEAKMTHDLSNKVQDIRLVVDALQDDGKTIVFYASQFAIYSERTGNVRSIDESFRSRFSYFYAK